MNTADKLRQRLCPCGNARIAIRSNSAICARCTAIEDARATRERSGIRTRIGSTDWYAVSRSLHFRA